MECSELEKTWRERGGEGPSLFHPLSLYQVALLLLLPPHHWGSLAWNCSCWSWTSGNGDEIDDVAITSALHAAAMCRPLPRPAHPHALRLLSKVEYMRGSSQKESIQFHIPPLIFSFPIIPSMTLFPLQ